MPYILSETFINFQNLVSFGRYSASFSQNSWSIEKYSMSFVAKAQSFEDFSVSFWCEKGVYPFLAMKSSSLFSFWMR